MAEDLVQLTNVWKIRDFLFSLIAELLTESISLGFSTFLGFLRGLANTNRSFNDFFFLCGGEGILYIYEVEKRRAHGIL